MNTLSVSVVITRVGFGVVLLCCGLGFGCLFLDGCFVVICFGRVFCCVIVSFCCFLCDLMFLRYY